MKAFVRILSSCDIVLILSSQQSGVLLQLFDRSGMLYGELARFVLRLLGIRTKPRKVHPPGPDGLPLPGPGNPHAVQGYSAEPKAAPTGSWDNVWENDASR